MIQLADRDLKSFARPIDDSHEFGGLIPTKLNPSVVNNNYFPPASASPPRQARGGSILIDFFFAVLTATAVYYIVHNYLISSADALTPLEERRLGVLKWTVRHPTFISNYLPLYLVDDDVKAEACTFSGGFVFEKQNLLECGVPYKLSNKLALNVLSNQNLGSSDNSVFAVASDLTELRSNFTAKFGLIRSNFGNYHFLGNSSYISRDSHRTLSSMYTGLKCRPINTKLNRVHNLFTVISGKEVPCFADESATYYSLPNNMQLYSVDTPQHTAAFGYNAFRLFFPEISDDACLENIPGVAYVANYFPSLVSSNQPDAINAYCTNEFYQFPANNMPYGMPCTDQSCADSCSAKNGVLLFNSLFTCFLPANPIVTGMLSPFRICNIVQSNEVAIYNAAGLLQTYPNRGYNSYPPLYDLVIWNTVNSFIVSAFYDCGSQSNSYLNSVTGPVGKICKDTYKDLVDSLIPFTPSTTVYSKQFQLTSFQVRFASANSQVTSSFAVAFDVAPLLYNAPCSGSLYFPTPYLYPWGKTTTTPLSDVLALECCEKSSSSQGASTVITQIGLPAYFCEPWNPSQVTTHYTFSMSKFAALIGLSGSSGMFAVTYYTNGTFAYARVPLSSSCVAYDDALNSSSLVRILQFAYGIAPYYVLYDTPTAPLTTPVTEPTFTMIGDYAQSAYALYSVYGIDSIYSLASASKVDLRYCSATTACALIPPGYYHIEYSMANVPVVNTTHSYPVHYYSDPVRPLYSPYSTAASVDLTKFHKTVYIKPTNSSCPYLSSINVLGYCYETSNYNPALQQSEETLPIALSAPTASLANTINVANGFYDQDVLFVRQENNTYPLYLPTLTDLYYVPLPVVSISLTGPNPVVRVQRASGMFTVSYNCYSKIQVAYIDTRSSSSTVIDCGANVIRYTISTQPLKFQQSGVIYTARQFTGYEDALTWQQQNPTLFWFIIVFAFMALPIALFIIWRLLIPAAAHAALLCARLPFVLIWAYRVLTFRWNPPLRRFWDAVSATGNFSGPIAIRTPPAVGLQFKRPSVPRLRYRSPFQAIMLSYANHLHVAVFLLLIAAAFGTEVNVIKQTNRARRAAATATTAQGLTQQVRDVEAPNRFGDLYANTYTVQSVNQNNASVLINFANNVGSNQMVTYMSSSTDSKVVNIAKPIIIKFYNSSVDLATTYLYTTGPSKTYVQNSCVFFSQRCDYSDLSTRLPCTSINPHQAYIGMDICCPTGSQSNALYASCLDPDKQQDYISCYNVVRSSPRLEFSVTIDGVEHPAVANGDLFQAGSCRGSATPVLTSAPNLDTICCDHSSCKACSATDKGTIAQTDKLGDIQMRGKTVDAAPIPFITRSISCGFGGYCSFQLAELGGYRQFNDDAVCSSNIGAIFGCLSTVSNHVSDTEEQISFHRCVNYVTLSMVCEATAVPLTPELLLTSFTVSCPQGIFAYLSGLVCNYTVTNGGTNSVSVKPTGYINNAVSPMLSISDVIVPPLSTVTCSSCIALSSNVKQVSMSFSIAGTNLTAQLTVNLGQPPSFTPTSDGGMHSITFASCSYGTKLNKAWSNTGVWIGNNLAFFITYFVVIAIITFVMYFLTFYYHLSAKYILIYSAVVIVVNIILAFVGPATMVVPGCD